MIPGIGNGPTNYVVASWSGARRVPDADYEHDRGTYIREHFAKLQTTDHEIDQITVVIPHDTDERKEYRQALIELPDRIGKARVVLLRRPNIGLSYGSFSFAYELFRDQFSWWLFNEDDYVFVPNYFDRILRDAFASSYKCGYVAGLIKRSGQHRPHAALCSGLTHSSVLERLWGLHGRLPHDHGLNYRAAELNGQVPFTADIETHLGYKLYDLGDRFRSAYIDRHGRIQVYYEENEDHLLCPVQLLRR